MSVSDGDIAFAVDLFSDLGAFTTRKMFGGMCLYHQGVVFALMSSDGRLYLKTKSPAKLFGQTTEQFHTMPYWSVPESALDDPQTACALARQVLLVL